MVDAAVCHYTLAVMLTAGLYETSGEWLYDVGLPAKSGIGGGIVTVSPGKGGMGTFAPRLDAAGNSVKGQLRRPLPLGAARDGPAHLRARLSRGARVTPGRAGSRSRTRRRRTASSATDRMNTYGSISETTVPMPALFW